MRLILKMNQSYKLPKEIFDYLDSDAKTAKYFQLNFTDNTFEVLRLSRFHFRARALGKKSSQCSGELSVEMSDKCQN